MGGFVKGNQKYNTIGNGSKQKQMLFEKGYINPKIYASLSYKAKYEVMCEAFEKFKQDLWSAYGGKRAYDRAYAKRPYVIEKRKEYANSPKMKKYMQAYMKNYSKTKKYKDCYKRRYSNYKKWNKRMIAKGFGSFSYSKVYSVLKLRHLAEVGCLGKTEIEKRLKELGK